MAFSVFAAMPNPASKPCQERIKLLQDRVCTASVFFSSDRWSASIHSHHVPRNPISLIRIFALQLPGYMINPSTISKPPSDQEFYTDMCTRKWISQRRRQIAENPDRPKEARQYMLYTLMILHAYWESLNA